MASKISKKHDGEIRVIFTKLTLDVTQELKEFFVSCLIDDFYELSELKSEFDDHDTDYKLLLAISNKKDYTGTVKWKACCVSVEEKIRVRSSSHNVAHDNIQDAFVDFRKIFEEFHINYDDDGKFSIIDALHAMEVFDQKTLNKTTKLLIKTGLDERFYTKDAAGRYVNILKSFLKNRNELKLNANQIENLLHILTSENFLFDEKKVQLETLKVLKILKSKDDGTFSKDAIKKVQKFLNDNRDTYKEAITECQKIIENDPREKRIHSMLAHVAQCRIDFLTSIAFFNAGVISDDLVEVMTLKIFNSNKLKVKENDLKIVSEEIKKEKILISQNLSPQSALINHANKFNDLLLEVNRLKAFEGIKSKLTIEEFLVEFQKSYSEIVNQGFMRTIKDVATNLIKKFKKGENLFPKIILNFF